MFILERNDSKERLLAFEGSSGYLRYLVQINLANGENETELAGLMETESPETFEAKAGVEYNRSSINIKPRDDGNGLCDVEVLYVQPRPLQFSYTGSGGSEKIEYSRATLFVYTNLDPEFDAIPDFEGGINVTKTGIEGTTIRTRNPQFQITKSWDLDEIDGAYLDLLEEMTPSVNNAKVSLEIEGIVREYDAGELLFEMGPGSITPDRRLEQTYIFSVSRNLDSDDPIEERTVGGTRNQDGTVRTGGIEVAFKEGWDLLWVYSEEVEDTTAKIMIRRPVCVMIERVYRRRDFADLGLAP
jgi:hypothetical protein